MNGILPLIRIGLLLGLAVVALPAQERVYSFSTLAGTASAGHRDGDRDTARFQHPIGLAFADGALFVADTYNSKIKKIDPKSGSTVTLAGGADHKTFFEPAGLAPASSGTLLVADTDHDRIVKLAIATGAVSPWGP